MKKCLNCGRDNPDENKFCSECGTMLPVIDSDEPSDLHYELFANHENESSTVNSGKQSAIPETKPETIDTINATPIPKISFPATLAPTRKDIKKIVIVLLLIAALIATPILIVKCLNTSYTDYGVAKTFYSHDDKQLIFDGNGVCKYDGLDCSYYISDNTYYITYKPTGKTITYSIKNEGTALINYEKTDGTIFYPKVRSGWVNTVFSGSGETYKLYSDGTFEIYIDGHWSSEGTYWLNEGVLVCKHTRSLTVYNSISYKIWWLYSYIEDNGQMYSVLLENPNYYTQSH